MKINIICIGSIKDNNLALLIKEYSNKISNFNKLEIIELKEITYKDESEQNINLSLAKEQEQIIKYLDESYNIALCIEGQQLDTIAFSNIFSDCFNHKSYLKQMNFIIGSSHGLSEQVKAKCEEL